MPPGSGATLEVELDRQVFWLPETRKVLPLRCFCHAFPGIFSQWLGIAAGDKSNSGYSGGPATDLHRLPFSLPKTLGETSPKNKSRDLGERWQPDLIVDFKLLKSVDGALLPYQHPPFGFVQELKLVTPRWSNQGALALHHFTAHQNLFGQSFDLPPPKWTIAALGAELVHINGPLPVGIQDGDIRRSSG